MPIPVKATKNDLPSICGLLVMFHTTIIILRNCRVGLSFLYISKYAVNYGQGVFAPSA